MAKDVQLDMAEVVLDKQYYCFNCKRAMEKMPNGSYYCANCGETFSEEQQ